jgi:colicin import membrane protein
MSAQSPSAYGLSALLHAGAVGLVLFFSYAASHSDDDTPKILEMVAGEGTNYAATAAPALGSPDGTKLTPPAPLPPEPAPVPSAALAPAPPAPAAPSPIQAAPEAAAKPTKAAPKPKVAKPPKPVDLVASLKRTEMRRERNLEARYQKERAAEEKRALAAEAKAARAARIDAEGIRQGVLGGSTENKGGGASGKALTREESSLLDAYFAELLAQIKQNHTPPEGVADNLSARVEFFVAADGSISRVKIIGSSGNADFDRSVVEACERTHSIGARPDGRSESQTFTFRMREDETG